MVRNKPEIYLEDHPLKHFAKGKMEKILLLTSENVGAIYLKPIEDFFRFKGLFVVPYIVSTKENNQAFKHLSKIYETLSVNHFEKTDGIVALGGMSLQEIAGFTAGSYLGGLSFFSLPTSYLSQLVLLNKSHFSLNFQKRGELSLSYTPNAVYLEPYFLETLEKNQLKNGYAYVALQILSYDFLAKKVETHTPSSQREWVALFKNLCLPPSTLQVNNLYQGLNLVELPGTFTYWETVAIYLKKLTFETEKRGLSEKGTLEKVAEVLADFSLECSLPENLVENGEYGDAPMSLDFFKRIGEISSFELTRSTFQQWFY